MPQAHYNSPPATTVKRVLQRGLVARHQGEKRNQVGRVPTAVHVAFRECDVTADEYAATHRPVAQMKLGGACDPASRSAGAEIARDTIRRREGKHTPLDAIEQRHDQSGSGGGCRAAWV